MKLLKYIENLLKNLKPIGKHKKIMEIKPLRLEQYLNILKDLFRKAIGNIEGKVDVIVHNSQLNQPFHPKIMRTKEAYETYLDVLTHKIDYKELNITECTFDFTVIKLPQGGNRIKVLDNLTNKRSVCQIRNTDNLCLSRSIVTALAIQNPDLLSDKLAHKKLTKNDVTYIKKSRLLQKTLAVKLQNLCNILLEVSNLEHVKIFEDFLEIQIIIFCRENFNERIYTGQYKKTSISTLYI